jgi:hypothetical protein
MDDWMKNDVNTEMTDSLWNSVTAGQVLGFEDVTLADSM